MKYALEISDLAAADLDGIMAYIAVDVPVRAESFVDEIVDKIRSLRELPKRCPIIQEGRRQGVELRHLLHGAYRIIFIIKGSRVIVVRVIHGARVLDIKARK